MIRSWIKAFKNESCSTFKMTKHENKFATVSFISQFFYSRNLSPPNPELMLTYLTLTPFPRPS